MLCQTFNNVSSPISGQKLCNIGLVTAFELFDWLRAALFRSLTILRRNGIWFD
jgi:hypothetical protein